MNEDWDDEDVLDINDPGLPDELREHGARFRKPACYVVDLGGFECPRMANCWMR